jgi:hypothetical protein
MKGKIDSDDNLEIQRGEKYKEQCCLYQQEDSEGNDGPCGGWCPQFGEPEEDTDSVYDKNMVLSEIPTGKTFLQICQGRVLEFDELIDERK